MSKNYSVTQITLTADQAAGTDPILGANSNRDALIVGVDGDCYLTGKSGHTRGWPLISGIPNIIGEGGLCPQNQLWISGLVAGSIVSIWEA